MTPFLGYRHPTVIRALGGDAPEVGEGAYVDATAVVIGSVRLGARASVWPQAVIRGDTDRIAVGDDTNIQDGAVLHADAGVPCTVGARVTIGHRAVVHGCTVEDEVLVGMGAIVMNRARIGTGSVVAAGALVPEGVEVPPGSMAVGVPARVVRPTTAAERDAIRRSAAHYVGMIGVHRAT
jgi:carbonic anhydrase/acetyltransferase-like protein (isoleucine patch superfamily)